MDYHANIVGVQWFARVVWPELARRHSDIDFVVVGRSPGQEVRALASDRVRVTGTVDDVRPYYRNAECLVVPLMVGGGTRLKILEAMAAGVPVVSTRVGAEGIEAESGRDLLIADSPADIVTAIDELLIDGEKRHRLSEAARELVRVRYDWRTVAAKLQALHENLVARRGARDHVTAD